MIASTVSSQLLRVDHQVLASNHQRPQRPQQLGAVLLEFRPQVVRAVVVRSVITAICLVSPARARRRHHPFRFPFLRPFPWSAICAQSLAQPAPAPG